jgi:hypothetical protein
MKLYTEETIRNLISHLDPLLRGDDWCELFHSLTPIELPSDEEIMYMSLPKKGGSHSSDYMEGFNKGAKWVIEQIKQQNGRE